MFSGVGKLSGYQLKLNTDRKITPIAQKPRRVPYALKEKVQQKIEELLDLDIIEKVSGPTTWVSPAAFVPKPNKDEVRICVDMRRANEAIQREKLPIPTVDEVLEEIILVQYCRTDTIREWLDTTRATRTTNTGRETMVHELYNW